MYEIAVTSCFSVKKSNFFLRALELYLEAETKIAKEINNFKNAFLFHLCFHSKKSVTNKVYILFTLIGLLNKFCSNLILKVTFRL